MSDSDDERGFLEIFFVFDLFIVAEREVFGDWGAIVGCLFDENSWKLMFRVIYYLLLGQGDGDGGFFLWKFLEFHASSKICYWMFYNINLLKLLELMEV